MAGVTREEDGAGGRMEMPAGEGHDREGYVIKRGQVDAAASPEGGERLQLWETSYDGYNQSLEVLWWCPNRNNVKA